MKNFKLGFVILASTGLLFLGACSGGSQENASTDKTETTNTAANTSKTGTAKSGESSQEDDDKKGHSEKHEEGKEHSHGGQVVETGKYHLEFVAEKEDKGTHLDLYLETGDKHETVPNAKVTADIQSPDGKQTTIPLTYDAEGKYYKGEISNKATGPYQVRINAEVGGEKLNGRFSFNQ
ncbi:hypothetical protein PI95_004080 [Hassallia byssoidea VB512170]|uniref:YtkA-like domain-containing protein n=1 Tax=Hassallia byssoidea VB512170 TaxID=1304833 RepID=A0A846H5C2_9CYAN|nr:hypothetical protein [Hassalia byssoidea]NEU71781.1 hypothetical protein [Hassalia byssoidea VB512170]